MRLCLNYHNETQRQAYRLLKIQKLTNENDSPDNHDGPMADPYRHSKALHFRSEMTKEYFDSNCHNGIIFLPNYIIYAEKRRLEITQLEKVRFIKVNELKLIPVEVFSFFTLCVLLLMHSECFV